MKYSRQQLNNNISKGKNSSLGQYQSTSTNPNSEKKDIEVVEVNLFSPKH